MSRLIQFPRKNDTVFAGELRKNLSPLRKNELRSRHVRRAFLWIFLVFRPNSTTSKNTINQHSWYIRREKRAVHIAEILFFYCTMYAWHVVCIFQSYRLHLCATKSRSLAGRVYEKQKRSDCNKRFTSIVNGSSLVDERRKEERELINLGIGYVLWTKR